MSLLKRVFGQKPASTQVFAHPELNFSNEQPFSDILALHQVRSEDAFQFCTEVSFDAQGRSVGARMIIDIPGVEDDMLAQSIKGAAFTRLDAVPHRLWTAEVKPDGKSKIGGAIPSGLELPETDEFASGYGYLGTLSCADPAFSHLREDVHMIWPHFVGVHPPLFVDISDGFRPKLKDRAACSMIDAQSGAERSVADRNYFFPVEEYEDIATLFAAGPACPEYDAVPFDMAPIAGAAWLDTPHPVHAGVPSWIQYPEIPKDPGTGTPMQYLCQISARPVLANVTVRPEPGSASSRMFEKMNAGGGVIYVFVSADTKTLCLLSQNN